MLSNHQLGVVTQSGDHRLEVGRFRGWIEPMDLTIHVELQNHGSGAWHQLAQQLHTCCAWVIGSHDCPDDGNPPTSDPSELIEVGGGDAADGKNRSFAQLQGMGHQFAANGGPSGFHRRVIDRSQPQVVAGFVVRLTDLLEVVGASPEETFGPDQPSTLTGCIWGRTTSPLRSRDG